MGAVALDQLVEFLRPIQFRGKRRILDPLLPRKGVAKARVFDATLPMDLANHVDRSIYMGCYEPLNTYRVKRILRPGMTVIDAGANIGYFSLLAARLVGASGKVLAFEPHPVNFGILAEAVKANGLAQVRCLQLGLDEKPGEGIITMPDQKDYPNRTASMMLKSGDSVRVETRSLDQVIEAEGLAKVDLLKIDVDGFETRILKGASRALERGVIRNIIVEFNSYWLRESGSSAEEVVGLLQGYEDLSRKDWLAAIVLGPSEDRWFVRR